MHIRNIAMLVDTDIRLSAALVERPGVEVYHVASEDDIDMALLNDLHSPLKLAFVGGDLAKLLSEAYGDIWIADSPTVEEDLLRFWAQAVV